VQGCQIFLGATYQNGKNIPDEHICNVPNGQKIYLLAVKYIKSTSSMICKTI
jgi:hypothetical protein